MVEGEANVAASTGLPSAAATSHESSPGPHVLASDKGPVIRYSREMGLTDEDFWRILPKAMGEHRYVCEARTVIGQVHAGSVEIQLGAPQVRRIALLRLPFREVSFTFRGVSVNEQQAFKQNFDLYFQRGGG